MSVISNLPKISANMSFRPSEAEREYLQENLPTLIKGLEDQEKISVTNLVMNMARNAASSMKPKEKIIPDPKHLERIQELEKLLKETEGKVIDIENYSRPEDIEKIETLEEKIEELTQELSAFKNNPPQEKAIELKPFEFIVNAEPMAFSLLQYIAHKESKRTGDKIEMGEILIKLFAKVMQKGDRSMIGIYLNDRQCQQIFKIFKEQNNLNDES